MSVFISLVHKIFFPRTINYKNVNKKGPYILTKPQKTLCVFIERILDNGEAQEDVIINIPRAPSQDPQFR